MVGLQEIVNDLRHEKRFDKRVLALLKNIRALAGDGLITASAQESNQAKAHRFLCLRASGHTRHFDFVFDIAEQLLLRWGRFGESAVIVPDTMTRLTLNIIALCAFDYRFNSVEKVSSRRAVQLHRPGPGYPRLFASCSASTLCGGDEGGTCPGSFPAENGRGDPV